MAYSDYGGYAYRNGRRVEARSDCVLTPEGVLGTPGMWPGWVIPEGRQGRSYHVLLGDGPIYVSLYKQSSVELHHPDERVTLLSLVRDKHPAAIAEFKHRGDPQFYVNDDYFRDNDLICAVGVDGHYIEIAWTLEDNYYVYARLVQPDGTEWHGFSGYGVGAGLEDGEYGYSTDEREERLWEIFPRPGMTVGPA